MNFNLSKCKVMKFGKSKRRIQWDYVFMGNIIEKSEAELYLGVKISENLTPDNHINKIIRETTNILRRIKMKFTYLDQEMIKKIIVSLIRPRLEYAAVVWNPYKKRT